MRHWAEGIRSMGHKVTPEEELHAQVEDSHTQEDSCQVEDSYQVVGSQVVRHSQDTCMGHSQAAARIADRLQAEELPSEARAAYPATLEDTQAAALHMVHSADTTGAHHNLEEALPARACWVHLSIGCGSAVFFLGPRVERPRAPPQNVQNGILRLVCIRHSRQKYTSSS